MHINYGFEANAVVYNGRTVTRAIRSLATLLLCLSQSFSQQGWTSQVSGTTRDLKGVFFTDANNGVVVGDGGTILRTTNGGRTWTSQPSGTTNHLYAVFFTDANTGFVAGQAGTILRTTDAGTTWGGLSSGTQAPLWGISFANRTRGIAVGPGFASSSLDSAGTKVYTTNAGNTWINRSGGSGGDILIALSAASFADSSRLIVVGYGLILRSSDAGTTWQGVFVPGQDKTFTAVSFADDSVGTVVGITNNGVGGVVMRTTDAGNNWSIQSSGVFPRLRSVYFTDRNTGTAVGHLGAIMRTTDGGMTWVIQASGTASILYGVFFTSADTGFAVGASGAILRTTNGGTVSVPIQGEEPLMFSLGQNYPNPFNPSTKIKYSLPSRQQITIAIYDVLGREVAQLVNDAKETGSYEIEWTSLDMPSGVYMYRMKAGGSVIAMKKMLLIR
jgi:hypothetical protein